MSHERHLALEFVRVTEAAAVASARLMGLGDKDAADQAAVDATRRMLDTVGVSGTIVIGEGERDEAPMLYIGEKVGGGGTEVDIALDPLEGTNLCAKGHPDSLCVLAVSEKGGFLHAPDTYMQKIAVGSECRGKIDILKPVEFNLRAIAECKRKPLQAVTVCILERDRHQPIIDECRRLGCRIKFIDDGDVSGAISTCNPDSGVDVLMGTGGAPEGVLAAAALKCLGGDFQGILRWRNEEEKTRARKMGIQDLDRVYQRDDLARGSVIFCVTGVTHGAYCKGVTFLAGNRVTTHSVVMRSTTRTIRNIYTTHHLDHKPDYF